MRVRLLLAAALTGAALATPVAADPVDDLREWCWDNTGFRVGALVCRRLPQ